MAYASGQGFTTGTSGASDAAMSDDLVLTLWSSKLHMETLRELWFTDRGMTKQETGDESIYERRSGAPVIIKDELGVGRGQRIRMALRKQLTTNVTTNLTYADNRPGLKSDGDNAATGGGVNGGISARTYGHHKTTNNMIDNEEGMELYDLEVVVELLKHAVAFSAPEIQDMRTSFKMEDEAATALRDWLVGQKEESILDSFYHKYPAHVLANGTGGHNAIVSHPNTVWANAATAQGNIGANDKRTAAALRQIYKEARDANINPISVGGADCFVVLTHVRAMQDLMADSVALTGLSELTNRAGIGQDNPIISRSQVYYSGCCVHEYNRVRAVYDPGGDNSDNEDKTIQTIVLGADALVMANGTEPRLVRRKEDRYEDVYGVGIKQVFGNARTDWMDRTDTAGNTLNQSSIRFMTYAA